MNNDMNNMNNDMNNDSDPFTQNDAAYVMGALTDADRRAFDSAPSIGSRNWYALR